MDYLNALQAELADCKQRNKTSRIKAIEAEIARVSGNIVEVASVEPVTENAAAPKRRASRA